MNFRGSARNPSGLPRVYVDTLGWVILLAWAGSFIFDMFSTDYTAPGSIHALMMIVVGASFTSTVIKSNNKPDDTVASKD